MQARKNNINPTKQFLYSTAAPAACGLIANHNRTQLLSFTSGMLHHLCNTPQNKAVGVHVDNQSFHRNKH